LSEIEIILKKVTFRMLRFDMCIYHERTDIALLCLPFSTESGVVLTKVIGVNRYSPSVFFEALVR